jgi:hypothetical protein
MFEFHGFFCCSPRKDKRRKAQATQKQHGQHPTLPFELSTPVQENLILSALRARPKRFSKERDVTSFHLNFELYIFPTFMAWQQTFAVKCWSN